MLNIVIPMAGRGSRFAKAGYEMPKPLIDIYGHPMIEYVTRNITPSCEHRFIYICQEEHIARFALDKKLNEYGNINAGNVVSCVLVDVAGDADVEEVVRE